MILIAAGLAASMWVQSDGVKVPIRNVSARYVLLQLAQKPNVDFAQGVESVMAPGVRVFLDPQRNGLVVKGTETGLRDLQHVINLFDVKPMGVHLEITGSVPDIGFERTSKVTVSNNTAFRFEDTMVDLGLSVRPRVNADQTVTLFFEVTRQGKQITTVVRVLLDEWVRLFVPRDGPITYESNKALEWVLKKGPRPTEQDAVILVRATVPER